MSNISLYNDSCIELDENYFKLAKERIENA